MQSLWLIFSSLSIILLVRIFLAYLQAIRSINNFPGLRTVFSSGGLTNYFPLPHIPGISTGYNYLFQAKYTKYNSIGSNIISTVWLWPRVQTGFIVADAAAIKEITYSRARFPKPTEMYQALLFFGRNIVASEGEEWKKFRKIAAPAFSDRNNKLVWDETVRIVNELFTDVWGNQDVVTVDHCVELTLPIALFVIGSAGFGRRISWGDDSLQPAHHKIPFKEAIHIVATRFLERGLIPRWAYLTESLRKLDNAFKDMELYMSEMIKERQESLVVGNDLLSSLLEANNGEEGEKLSESELQGNVFVFLLAGHETTAHTLAYTFALLALHQDEQEILYKHIKSVIPKMHTPTYTDMPLLTQSLAVFYETLRLFPPVPGIPKYSAEDTTLTIRNENNAPITIPVPKGSSITINTVGLHYNPHYWEDPDTFKPSRFLRQWPRDAFLPFSAGPRACIGRKFFETEGIAILTMFIMRYRIEVKEEPQFSGESFEARKARILQTKIGLTLTPARLPLVFTKRV